MPKEIIFKIKIEKELPIDFSEQQMKCYPVHEHCLAEERIIKVVYNYKPTLKTEQKSAQLKEFLIEYLKRKYNTQCVVVI
jgi:hypothetical protein